MEGLSHRPWVRELPDFLLDMVRSASVKNCATQGSEILGNLAQKEKAVICTKTAFFAFFPLDKVTQD